MRRKDDGDIDPTSLVVIGKVTGLYGVKGWVKVYSHTVPPENILGYAPWFIRRGPDWKQREAAEGRRHGKGVIARLEGVENRDAAASWIGTEIAVPREAFESLSEGEYYWIDLEGLEVVTTEGIRLGVIGHLFETGANDVMVIKGERERLVPFVQPEVVREVNFTEGRVLVDWDPEF